MINALARIRRLLEGCCLQVPRLRGSHGLVVEHLEACGVRGTVRIVMHLVFVDVERFRNSMLVVVTCLDSRNHRLLLGHTTLVLAVFRRYHRLRLALKDVLIEARNQAIGHLILATLCCSILLLSGSSSYLTILSNRVLHQTRALFCPSSSFVFLFRRDRALFRLLRVIFLAEVLLHAVLVELDVVAVLLRIFDQGLLVAGLLDGAALLDRCLTRFHLKQKVTKILKLIIYSNASVHQ